MSRTLEDNIKEINSDLSTPIEDKSLYLAQLTSERIKTCSRSFDERIDHYLSQLEKSEMTTTDLSRMSRSLKSFSKLVSLSYRELMQIVRNYKNNLK